MNNPRARGNSVTEGAFWTPIVAAAAALSGVFLQSYLTRRSTMTNRIWDLKREAYADILRSIRELQVATSSAANLFEKGQKDGPALQAHYDNYTEQQKALRRRMASDSIILPEAVIDHYEKVFKRRIDTTAKDLDRIAEARLIASHLEDLQGAIAKIAKEDLGVQKR